MWLRSAAMCDFWISAHQNETLKIIILHVFSTYKQLCIKTKCSAREDDKRNSSCEIVPAVHLNSLKVGGACLCDNSLHSHARSLVFIYTDGAKSQPPSRQMLKNTHALLAANGARAAEIIHNFGRFVCGRMFSGWTRSCPRGIINTDKCKLNFQQAPCKRARLYLVQTSSAFIKWET